MKRPRGFTLLAIFLAWALCADVLELAVHPGRAGPVALWNALIIAVSAVFAEALWRCRPWVTRVATAWVAMRMAGVVIRAAHGRAETLLEPGARAGLVLPLAFLGVILAYVYHRARRPGALQAGAPVPVPVP